MQHNPSIGETKHWITLSSQKKLFRQRPRFMARDSARHTLLVLFATTIFHHPRQQIDTGLARTKKTRMSIVNFSHITSDGTHYGSQCLSVQLHVWWSFRFHWSSSVDVSVSVHSSSHHSDVKQSEKSADTCSCNSCETTLWERNEYWDRFLLHHNFLMIVSEKGKHPVSSLHLTAWSRLQCLNKKEYLHETQVGATF